MHSRPMTTLQIDTDGNIWFMSGKSEGHVEEVNKFSNVCLNYSHRESNAYLCVTGKAKILFDKSKIRELWRPEMREFFPKGDNDPDIVLIKVIPIEASYWNLHENHAVTLFEMIGSMISDNKEEHGDLKLKTIEQP